MPPSRAFLLLVVCVASTLGQELCDENGNGKIDGILPDSDNQLLIVKGGNYWKLGGNLTNGFSLSPGYPKKVETRWPGLNTSIEHAFYDVLSETTYFILDELCWAFNGTQLLPSYPKPIKDDPLFSTINEDEYDDLDLKRLARLADQSNTFVLFPFDLSYIYFFKDTEYTKYRMPGGPIEQGYPKSLVPFWFQCPVTTSKN